MKKETLIEIILSTVGGLIFSIGMCMCLIPEWNMFLPGVITSIVGFIILLCIIFVYKKEHPKKQKRKIDTAIAGTFIVGIIGSLVMGFGMSRVMTGTPSELDMIIGIITGIIGLMVCVLNYPIYSYIKSNSNEKENN